MASQLPEDTVTICIPAYRAAGFLARTVDTALAQTHPNVRTIITVEPTGDGTAEVARRYASDSVLVLENTTRLGWVANTNRALTQVQTRYAMVLPHDDFLDPQYVEACLAELRRHPDAVICYPDLGIVGRPGFGYIQESISGPLPDRISALLTSHFNSVAFRGIIDRQAAPQHLIPSAIGGFAADTLFLARLAAQGELIRLPQTLYSKYLSPTTAHRQWAPSSTREALDMWAVHCLEMLTVLVKTRPDLCWTRGLQLAWEQRVRKGYAGVVDPALSDPNLDVRYYALAIAEKVKARPRPYSWVKA